MSTEFPPDVTREYLFAEGALAAKKQGKGELQSGNLILM
jgi:hypothetical protein